MLDCKFPKTQNVQVELAEIWEEKRKNNLKMLDNGLPFIYNTHVCFVVGGSALKCQENSCQKA